MYCIFVWFKWYLWYSNILKKSSSIRNLIFRLKEIQSNLCLAATQGKHKKWLLKAGGCLIEVTISTFGNILIGCLRQDGCLTEVIANTGLTVNNFYRVNLLFLKTIIIVILKCVYFQVTFILKAVVTLFYF